MGLTLPYFEGVPVPFVLLVIHVGRNSQCRPIIFLEAFLGGGLTPTPPLATDLLSQNFLSKVQWLRHPTPAPKRGGHAPFPPFGICTHVGRWICCLMTRRIHFCDKVCIACHRFWCLRNHNYGLKSPRKVLDFFVSTAVWTLTVRSVMLLHVCILAGIQWYRTPLHSKHCQVVLTGLLIVKIIPMVMRIPLLQHLWLLFQGSECPSFHSRVHFWHHSDFFTVWLSVVRTWAYRIRRTLTRMLIKKTSLLSLK